MNALRAKLVASVLRCAFAQLSEDLEEFHSEPNSLPERVSENVSSIAPLNLPGFVESVGHEGLWRPLRFVREGRAGVHMLEPYSPDKVPVVLVHGAGATPRAWLYFIEHLDATRYQAWVYQYPTGVPIDVSAQWLSNILGTLEGTLGFDQMIVVGHSMGGLVARRSVALNAGTTSARYALVTFSAPWGGVPLARFGARLGRLAVPSWMDLVPDSAFLRVLQTEPLPATVPHHLFFAYRKDGDELDSDGMISVSSQLESHVRRRAAGIYGFRAGHGAIIEDLAVFTRFAAILNDLSTGGGG